jgi:outer membrane protein assembly factor BamD
MKKYLYVSLILLLTLAASCSSKTAAVKPVEEFDAETVFSKANKLIDDKDYNQARALLLEVKNRDLTKKFSPLAQLRIADSFVKEEELEAAVQEYRQFMEMYPDHRYASYAQYQIAMVYYNTIEGPERGYGGAARALAEFEKLKRDFPRNPYKDSVEVKMEKCRNIIADYEFLVGEFYMKKGAYAAAIERFEGLLRKHPDYKKEGHLLLNLGVSFKKTGQKEKSEEYFKRLIEKYPNTPPAKEASKELASLKPGSN